MSDLACPARLMCVRHAESTGNAAGLLSAVAPGPPLSERGAAQAAALGARLRPESPRAVVSSPLRRARETAAVVAADLGLGVTVMDGLREFGIGSLEGSADPGAAGVVDALFLRWLDGVDLDRGVGGDETGQEVLARMTATLDEVADRHRGEAVVVVSHGGVLAVTLSALCPEVGASRVRAEPLGNASVSLVLRDADGWSAQSWGAL